LHGELVQGLLVTLHDRLKGDPKKKFQTGVKGASGKAFAFLPCSFHLKSEGHKVANCSGLLKTQWMDKQEGFKLFE
jgi:hypothetical protein